MKTDMEEKANKPVDIYRDTWVRFLGRYSFYSSCCLTCKMDHKMEWNITPELFWPWSYTLASSRLDNRKNVTENSGETVGKRWD